MGFKFNPFTSSLDWVVDEPKFIEETISEDLTIPSGKKFFTIGATNLEAQINVEGAWYAEK